MLDPPPLALQIVGGGVAAAGLVVAADRRKLLGPLLQRGLLCIERSARGWLTSLDYDIESNSSGAEFVSEIRRDGIFAQFLHEPATRVIAEAHGRSVNLRRVAACMRRLMEVFEEHAACEGHPEPVRYGTTVRRLVIERDGTFVSFDEQLRPLARSRVAVLAVGGDQRLDERWWPRAAGEGRGPSILGSDPILRGHHDDECERRLRSGGRVLVLGGSHSGWSVVERLLRLGQRALEPGQIIVSHRQPTVVYFPSVEIAHQEGTQPQPHQICPDTGQVNRFEGLRGPAAAVFRRHRDGQLPAVRTQGPLDARWRVDGVAMLVLATGYRPRTVELLDHRGLPVYVDAEFGNLKLTSKGSVICRDRAPIRNLFGLGLGHAVRRFGEYRAAVNVFHGEAADHILDQIDLDDMHCPAEANHEQA